MEPNNQGLAKAVEILSNGGNVAIPTETVYGLAANALDENAVVNIFQIKNRPSFDPLIVHIGYPEDLDKYVTDLPMKARILARRFWPGPLTLILKKKDVIPGITTAGLPTVGIRIPNHPLSLSLLQHLPFPLAAPSANPFGYISPTSAQHVRGQLGDKTDMVLDGGECSVGLESTIIGFENGDPVLYRIGGLGKEAIEKEIGPLKTVLNTSSDPKAPGMLKKHYAPRTRLVIGDPESLIEELEGNIGILSFSTDYGYLNPDLQMVLSPGQDIKEAARNLFKALHRFDAANLDCIIAEKFPDIGMGPAINDRLNRASSK